MTTQPFYSERVRRFSRQIETILFDAFSHMDDARGARGLSAPQPQDVRLHSVPHTDAYGRDVQVCAIQDHITGCTVVYDDFRHLRTLANPTDAFWAAIHAGQPLPERGDEEAWSALEQAAGPAG